MKSGLILDVFIWLGQMVVAKLLAIAAVYKTSW